MGRNTKEPEIRKYYKPSDAEEKELAFVYDRFTSMKDSPQRKDAEAEWDKGEKAWDQCTKEDEDLEDWQADYYVPLTTAIVEDILSEMIGQSPRPIVLPRSDEDIPKATVMKHIFEYSWEVADGDEELENVLKDCLIYGNGFAQEYYWKDRRMIRTLSAINKNKKVVTEKYNEYEDFDYDDVYMESVSPYELYFDEMARTINRGPYKARDAIRRMVMKLEDAKIFFSGDVWNPYDNMKFVVPGKDTGYYSFFKPPEDVKKDDEVEVLWYTSRRPKDALNIVINDVFIKGGPNPYKHKQLPYAMTYDVKRPHKFYHKGEPKLLESIQKEVNILRRMITDRNHLDIDKMFLVSNTETYKEDDTITRPHGIIRVDDPANYKPIEYGDIPTSVGLTLQELDRDATKVSGVDLRPQAARTPITATDAAIMKEQLVKRIAAKLRRLEKGFLIDIGRIRMANFIQFYSQPKMEEIIGEAGSKEYDKKVRDAQAQGLLVMQDGKPYIEKYRNIRIKNKKLIPDANGTIVEQPWKGYTFFDLKPKDYTPIAQGGFNIAFEAGATMPVSKPLMAKQIQDAVAQLMPLATAGVGYDPVKLGDKLLESLDQNPDEYHADQAPEKDIEQARKDAAVNLAATENSQVAAGQTIPKDGTPYASAAHTMIHIAFIRSPQGKSLPMNSYAALVKHTMGEIALQEARGGGVASLTGTGQPPISSNNNGGSTPQSTVPPAPTNGGGKFNLGANVNMPPLIQGGEGTPSQTQKGSVLSRVFSLFRGNPSGK